MVFALLGLAKKQLFKFIPDEFVIPYDFVPNIPQNHHRTKLRTTHTTKMCHLMRLLVLKVRS